jgi:hypothetical protein
VGGNGLFTNGHVAGHPHGEGWFYALATCDAVLDVVQDLLAIGGKVIKCPSLLNVLKDTYDRSCY